MTFSPLEYISTIKNSGTIVSSSKHLVKKCIKDVDFSKASVIIEFGMGDGCITQEILKKSKKDTLIISFEINPKFCAYCKEKFKNYSSLKIYNTSAFDFESVLLEHNISKVDYVISSLPISLFGKNRTLSLLENIKNYLDTDGFFIQYQYSLDYERFIKEVFTTVNRDFTLLNIPPAFIYKCA